jgi:hypothetical protein
MSVYLLHFERPLHHASHYCGYVEDGPEGAAASVERRLSRHLRGGGSPLVAAVHRAGISVEVARVWPGASRGDERRLKRRKGAPRLCPICNPGAGELPDLLPVAAEDLRRAARPRGVMDFGAREGGLTDLLVEDLEPIPCRG